MFLMSIKGGYRKPQVLRQYFAVSFA